MKAAFLFPGQGAQHVGMGRDLYEAFPAARRLFDQAEQATRLPISTLCFHGPEEALARTDNAQPAIFTVSAATLAVIEDLLGPARLKAFQPEYMAGLSLGEYTALYAAGTMDFATGVKLVAERGRLMQQAAVAVPSGMVSIIGLDEAKAGQLCQAARGDEVLTCANFNCPGQIVLSGQLAACRRAAELAEEFGALKAVPLKVAGAFHSELMAPAARAFAAHLDGMRFKEPAVKVVSNVDARPYRDASQISRNMVSQLVSPVRWQQSMEFMLAEGVEEFYEIGPGRVLAGLMRRMERRVSMTSINSREAAEKVAQ